MRGGAGGSRSIYGAALGEVLVEKGHEVVIVGEGLAEGVKVAGEGATEDGAGADEAGEGEGGKAEDAQEGGGIFGGGGGGGELDEAADVDAHEAGLVLEVEITVEGGEVGEVGGGELVGVEAVFEGVGVAKRGAGMGFEGRVADGDLLSIAEKELSAKRTLSTDDTDNTD